MSDISTVGSIPVSLLGDDSGINNYKYVIIRLSFLCIFCPLVFRSKDVSSPKQKNNRRLSSQCLGVKNTWQIIGLLVLTYKGFFLDWGCIMWVVKTTDRFDLWFKTQSDRDRADVLATMLLLPDRGPRPTGP